MSRPRDEGFFMPAEWTPHKRCWMEWPNREEIWGGPDGLDSARDAYAEVAMAIARFEPVTMISNPENVAEVSLRCGSGSGVSTLSLAHDDSWMRDNGPTFLIDGKGGIAGVDWQFNGWGGRYTPHDQDADVPRALLEHLEIRRFEAPIVLEGGSIHVDGEGTLIAVEESVLNPNRNPGMELEEVEDVLRAYLGIEKIIWLSRGLQDDETDGHVDNVACFLEPGKVMVLATDDEDDGNHDALADAKARLDQTEDAKGRPIEVVEVKQPKRRQTDSGTRLALSYVNFYRANDGGVVIPAFDDPMDEAAYDVFARLFGKDKVLQVLATEITRGGGGIHCVTQQQPLAETD